MHEMQALTYGQYSFVYNALSFAIAALGAATIFLFLSRSQVSMQYKSAVTISGLVCLIAAYHYYRILIAGRLLILSRTRRCASQASLSMMPIAMSTGS